MNMTFDQLAERGNRQWSPMQQAIFDDVQQRTEGDTVIIARAGTGKTTTSVEAANRVPRRASLGMFAFNSSIAAELSQRAPRGAWVKTFHGAGNAALYKAFGQLPIDEDKVPTLIRNMLGGVKRDQMNLLCKAVSLCKGTLAEDAAGVLAVVDDFDLEVPEPQRDGFAALVLRILDACAEHTTSIDFDDMVWMPLRLNLPLRAFDRLFIDEVQDLNKSQVALAIASCRTDGRICAVGDDRQAIYGWRGADPEAVPRLIKHLGAKVLPLSITYRCARSIVERAQEYVPDFAAAQGAPEGLVAGATFGQLARDAQPGDFVLSRTNAPLVSLCMQWLTEGRPAAMAGRDIGAGLVSMVKRSEARDVPGLLTWVEGWRESEVLRLEKKGRDTAAATDKAECMTRIASGARSIDDVLSRLDRLFSDKDDGAKVLLSSTHRAKGLERDRVWMLRKTYKPDEGVEEQNLTYVAITRARRELRLVA